MVNTRDERKWCIPTFEAVIKPQYSVCVHSSIIYINLVHKGPQKHVIIKMNPSCEDPKKKLQIMPLVFWYGLPLSLSGLA